MDLHYLNLTNGIEAISEFEYPRFIRVQSTLCEQKNWNKLIQELDYDFLFNIAIGNNVFVHDFSNKRDIPRALYQGIPAIEYFLNKYWLNIETKVFVRGNNATNYFKDIELNDRSKGKLNYFKRFVNISIVKINICGNKTCHDGDYNYYSQVLKNSLI